MARPRRDEVLEVAASIFNEHGYQSATLEDIGNELGFTRAALYYYFKSKQDILVAILDDAAETLNSSLQRILAEGLSPRDCLRRIVINHIAVVHSRPDVFGVYLAEPTSLPGPVRQRMLVDLRAYVRVLTTVFERGVEQGHFNPEFPAKVVVLLLLAMANNTLEWFHPKAVERRELDAATLGELIFTMAFDGLGVGPTRPVRNGKTVPTLVTRR